MKYFKDTIVGILLLNLSILFSSCNTTSKIKSISKSTIDSVSVGKIDSATVKLIDSTTVKKDKTITTVEKQDDYEKETVIDFDTSRTGGLKTAWIEYKDGVRILHTPTDAADYFPPVIKITIKERGVKKERTKTVQNLLDSTTKKELSKTDLTKSVNTDLHKKETVKNKEVKRTSYWGYLWFLLIPVIWLGGWYFGLWPLLPKRKAQDDYPVKYKNYNPPKPPTK